MQKNLLYFPTIQGVSSIDPLNISLNTNPPIVKITQITIDGTTRTNTEAIKLKPETKRIQIDYSGLSFTIPERVKFRYQLEGFDKEYNEITSKRQATYTNLPPGNYVFKVLAANNDEIWNSEPETFLITQLPYFYQQWYFYLIIVFIVIILIYFFYKLRFRLLKEHQKNLENILKQKTATYMQKRKINSLLLT